MPGIIITKKEQEELNKNKKSEDNNIQYDEELERKVGKAFNDMLNDPDFQQKEIDYIIEEIEKQEIMEDTENETHPFMPFLPLNASVLILGSFPKGRG